MKILRIYITLGVVFAVQLGLGLYLTKHVWSMKKELKRISTPSSKEGGTGDEKTARRVHGCDLSHWDGKVDWSGLKKSNVKFVYTKATQGGEYVDPSFELNWTSARTYGFIRGAYHFYQPGIDPTLQAEHFLSTVQHEKGDLIPVLDIEIRHNDGPEQLTKDIKIWIDKVYKSIGRYPMIYTDYGFWNSAIDGSFSYCPLWLAEWDNGRPPVLPRGWKTYDFWQYTSSGTLPGISETSHVDLDYFEGGMNSIKQYQLR